MKWTSLLLLAPLLIVPGCVPSEPPKPAVDYNKIARDALAKANLPAPNAIELTDNGWLTVTFQLEPVPSEQRAKAFAEKALLAIRNSLYDKGMSKFRVTLNGTPPRPGLISRLGSARFIEGGAVEWAAGK